MDLSSFAADPSQYVANQIGGLLGGGGGNPQIVDALTFSSLQASFDSKVLSGEMSEQDWYAMVASRYPQYVDLANIILTEYREGTRGTYTSGGMTRPDSPPPSPSYTPSASPSLLQSPDAAFIAAAVAVLGIALLVIRRK